MNFNRLPDSGVRSTHPVYRGVSAVPAALAAKRERLSRSRRKIVSGSMLSAIGIVNYCLVMSGGDPQADLLSALTARGGIGWMALSVVMLGVAVWMAGCAGVAQDADALPAEGDKR